jgi:hypothetical protein
MPLSPINNGDTGLATRTTLNQLIALAGTNFPFDVGSLLYVDGSGNIATHPGGTLRLGGPDVASPTVQLLTVPGVAAGTANGSAPQNGFGIQGCLSTGAGVTGIVSIYTGFKGWAAGLSLTSITQASPAVFTTATAHNLFAGQTILLFTTGTLPAPLAVLTTYYVSATGLTATQFQLSATPGGASINTTTAGSGTHSYQGGSTVTIGGAFFSTPNSALALAPGMQIQFQTTGTLPSPLVPGTTYFIAGVANGFYEISATLGGNVITTSGSQSGTHTFVVMGGTTQNPASPLVTFGSSFLIGSDDQAGMAFFQQWSTNAQFGVGITYAIQNLNFATQDTKFQRFNLNNGNVNPLGVFALAGGNSWRMCVGDTVSSALPYLDFDVNSVVTLAGTRIQTLAGGAGTVVYSDTNTYTVATLPAAGNKNARLFVTDATQTLTAGIGTVVAGGGANNVPVIDDGTNWRIG